MATLSASGWPAISARNFDSSRRAGEGPAGAAGFFGATDLSALLVVARAGSDGFTEVSGAGGTATSSGALRWAGFSAGAATVAGAGAVVCGTSSDWASGFELVLSMFNGCGADDAFGGIAGDSTGSRARCHKSNRGGQTR